MESMIALMKYLILLEIQKDSRVFLALHSNLVITASSYYLLLSKGEYAKCDVGRDLYYSMKLFA